jgi:hypothetical protein
LSSELFTRAFDTEKEQATVIAQNKAPIREMVFVNFISSIAPRLKITIDNGAKLNFVSIKKSLNRE